MSNQSAESLHVLRLDLAQNGYVGRVESVIAPAGQTLEIALHPEAQPAGCFPVGGGIAFVRDVSGLARADRPDTSDCLIGNARSSRCTWSVPPRGDALAILILPAGRRLSNPEPKPLEVFTFEGREAAIWRPGRRPVVWNMAAVGTGTAEIVEETAGVTITSPAVGSGAGAGRPLAATTSGAPRGAPAGARKRRRLQPALAIAAVVAIAGGAALWLPRGPGDATPAAGPLVRGVQLIEEPAPADSASLGQSYALVIGIEAYPSARWPRLNYPRKDAAGMAEYLRGQGFAEVRTLLDEEATKTAIIHEMQNGLAPRLGENDRVLVFFAGHGYTERLGDRDWGYIVPYDGTDNSATYVSMEEIQTLSEKMGKARQQLFVLDACYGGLLAMRGSGVDPATPNYIREITRRPSRQILTAGGKDQQVLDSGPEGHSVFTGHLLEGLQGELADGNGDGYITFAELVSFVVPRATNRYQTPAAATLPGHGLGEFVFRTKAAREPAAAPVPAATGEATPPAAGGGNG